MFNSNFYSVIPTSLLSLAYRIGETDFAWESKNIPIVLDFLRDNSQFILGGDVYELSMGKIIGTYDSWYINPNRSSFSESYKLTIQYINEYESKNSGKFLYALVWRQYYFFSGKQTRNSP